MTKARQALLARLTGSLPVHGSIVGVATEERTVVMTYGDGPSPDGTPGVLDALAEAGATATFFVLVGRARKYPELLERIVAGGHELALHGDDHVRLTDFSEEVAYRRTLAAKQELEQLSGQSIEWFRPPYGSQSIETWQAVKRAGLQTVLWTATAWDVKDVGEHERVAHAVRHCHQGSILLAHDGFAGPADGVDDGPEPEVDRGALAAELLSGFAREGLIGRSLRDALVAGKAVRRARFSE